MTMNNDHKVRYTRRDLLRFGTLGGIAAMAGRLIAKGWGKPASACPQRGACRGCGVAGHCKLPEAMAMRQQMRQENEQRS